MAVEIHPLAIVDPTAQIDNDCSIGPFCTIGPQVELGARTKLQSHVVIAGKTRIGADCSIFPFVSLGVQSQDLKFQPGNQTFTEIGSNTIIREYVTVHSGTEDGTGTRVGHHCALLAQSHVAHNCTVGHHVILSHGATLGGHVTVADYANLGGLCAVHQFVHIGHYAMIAGMARLVQDVLPYTLVEGTPAVMRGINRIGLTRVGITPQEIKLLQKAFRILFKRGMRLEEATNELRQLLGSHQRIKELLDFIALSQRGLARPPVDWELDNKIE